MTYDKELAFAKEIALEAGGVIRNNFRKVVEHELKADETPVTVVDKAINKLLIERVQAQFPEDAIVGEEESFGPTDAKRKWVCDPIDGTIKFMHHIPISSFSLALVVDGESVVGVIYDPYQDRLWSAAKGQGAFRNDEKVHVLDAVELRNQYIVVEGWSKAKYNLLPTFEKLKKEEQALVYNLGTTAYVTGLVAEGAALALIGAHTTCWDIAAAAIIVEEAGGKVTDLQGNRQRYDETLRGAIVSNGKVHDKLVSVVNDENLRD